MKIPKRFKLLGSTIEVKDNQSLLISHNWAGAADYNKHVIEIVPASDAFNVSETKIEQTFCHELMHFILYYGGGVVDGCIHQNEELVEILGCLLHQALTTMEYE